jgi:hypothetical protein
MTRSIAVAFALAGVLAASPAGAQEKIARLVIAFPPAGRSTWLRARLPIHSARS